MIPVRIIPTLLLRNGGLVKTVNFKKYSYVGDPCNTIRIFNEMEVDELIVLDIDATKKNNGINFALLKKIASECFMPIVYGGGIRNIDEASKVFNIGFEKILLNTYAYQEKNLIPELVKKYGSQAIIASIDVRKNYFGNYRVFIKSGKIKIPYTPLEWALEVQKQGAGEILLTSIDCEGTWNGFDIELTRSIAENLTIPLIANGGAGTINDIVHVVRRGKASAVGLSSMLLYQGKDKGVLINFPEKNLIEEAFETYKKDE
ncbi:AglZ/HisF2 family acetamidino modification protein [Polynucleobacter difficilis]|uniref:AglZ/HisF2 family acetamidino modification protein n=1 Tax=Polynucleobacter difficilis TaxID=556054 RepID=UPI000D37B79F|nr:AglZ/HisF2 family acetamidino modification protein [Polynucleobacter difficilis]